MKPGRGLGLRAAVGMGAGLAVGLAAAAVPGGAEEPVKPVALPLSQARQMVRMMNDIYLSGVIATHKMYVQDPGMPAAVTWGKQVIRQVRAKGWPDAHIFDTTGRPLNPENSPKDAFEKEAVAAFTAGKKELERTDGGVYRLAVPLRILDESCVKCHVRAKPGDLVGGVSYEVRLVPGK